MHRIVVPVSRKAVIPIEMELAEDEQSDDSTSEKEDEDPNLQCYMNDWQEKGIPKAADCSLCEQAPAFAFGKVFHTTS